MFAVLLHIYLPGVEAAHQISLTVTGSQSVLTQFVYSDCPHTVTVCVLALVTTRLRWKTWLEVM